MPVSVRYIVSDVDAAIPFYTEMLGFNVDMHPAPGFASLSRGDLRLLRSQALISRVPRLQGSSQLRERRYHADA